MSRSIPYDKSEIPGRVMLSQMLWTAGHSLTSGSFLSFFLVYLMNPYHSALGMSLLFAIPDIMGISGTSANFFAALFGSRKHAWIYSTLLSRGIFIIYPVILTLFNEQGTGPIIVIPISSEVSLFLFLVALSWFFQNIAYVNLVTWITELYPEKGWNQLFGKWEIAKVGIMIIIPSIAAGLKYTGSHLKNYGLVNISEFWFYLLIFATGCSLQLLSLAPLLKFPSLGIMKEEFQNQQSNHLSALYQIFTTRSLFFLILGSWWLAFFQGLTQSVFFSHATKNLGITLEMYVGLNSTLYLCQTLLCFPTIWLINKAGAKLVYFFSLLLVSTSLICWILSTRETWWLVIFAYILWGFFAPVNITGNTLICRLSHENHQALSFALFRTVAGVFAGIAGIYGGYLMEQGLQSHVIWGIHFHSNLNDGWSAVQIMIFISFLGRITAPLWVLFVSEPKLINQSEVVENSHD